MSGKKRKSDAKARLDEVDRSLYSAFCGAANSLSHVYTLATNQQKLSFQAGERQALEKLCQWIMRQNEEGSRLTVVDIVGHIQEELDFGGEDVSMSPRVQNQHQLAQSSMTFMNTVNQNSFGLLGQVAPGLAPRVSHSDLARNTASPNSSPGPVRQGLQSYQLPQSGMYPHGMLSAGDGARNHEKESLGHGGGPSHSLHDSSMDMHQDTPN